MNINIANSNLATQAAEWCCQNKIPYDLEYWGWPGSTIYKFCFQNEVDMMVFSLKWTQ